MENEKEYNKFYSNFDPIIRRFAQLNPNLFNHIDLEDFIIFFEEPCSKGKNKGLPRSYNIFNQCLKNSKTKFSDDNYIADVCLALTYNKISFSNGLNTTIGRAMIYEYKESAHCKTAFVDYESLENELYTDDITPSLAVTNDLEDILYHKVFEKGYLNSYFNGSDLIMLKEYLESRITSQSTSIKDFTNNYSDSRMLTHKAYDTRLRNIFKAWVAVLSVKFGLWTCLAGFDTPFTSFQESVDYLNNLKTLKERKEYIKKLNKEPKEPEEYEEHESSVDELSKGLRVKALKEYLTQRFDLRNIKRVSDGFEVKIGNKWCAKYFLNGGYNNCKTGEKGSWLSLLV